MCEAIHKAVVLRVPTAFVSMEMGEKLLREQMAGCMANVSAFAFRKGMYSPAQRQRMILAFDLLSKAPLFINDSRMSIEQTVAWLSSIIQKHKVRLVIADYIQLMKSSKGRGNLGRTEQVMEWSGELKEFFKKTGTSGIVLSQLSRQGIKLESVTPAAPMLEALRDSGAIEQDADVVIFVYKKPGEPMESFFSDRDWQSELSVAKNRVGPTGRTPVLFVRSRQRFQDEEGGDWTNIMRPELEQGEL
jgi:replicative DNA helicase